MMMTNDDDDDDFCKSDLFLNFCTFNLQTCVNEAADQPASKASP